MRYRVNHTTRYSYSKAVFFEPHLFRMRPRSDVSQRLDNFSLVLHPQAVGFSHGLDVENNAFCLAWFEGLFDSLEIISSFAVETLRENPFDALLIGDSFALPLSFADQEQIFLAPYLRHGQALEPPDHLKVQGLAEEICRSVRNDPLAFLHELNQRLFKQIVKVERTETGIQTVHQ
ncbi:MAG: transglutaminase family protein, partial [Deltaproteobacteria bacterium]|nr:transglutaminase family protein [Deltaproteobacteria bacterium]